MSEDRARLEALSREELVDRLLRADRRERAIVDVGRLFVERRPLPELLRELVEKNVESLADISLVHLVLAHGAKGLLTTAVAARDPAIREAVREHIARRPIRFDEHVAAKLVYETGRGILLSECTPEALARLTPPDDAPFFARLGLRSAMALPMRGRDGVIGTMDFGSTGPSRRYGPEDYDLAQEIADRAAAAVENGRLVQRLEEERALLASVVESMPEGVVIFGPSGEVVLANHIARGLDGVTVQRAGRAVQVERSARRRADGVEVPILLNAAPVVGPSGEVKATVAVFQDVTERKWFEARVAELAELATARAGYLETVISCIAEGVVVADASGRVVISNAAAARLFGVPADAFGWPLAHFAGRFRPRAPACDEACRWAERALAGETVYGLEGSIEDGSGATARHVRLSAAPLRDTAGAVVVAADVSRARDGGRPAERTAKPA